MFYFRLTVFMLFNGLTANQMFKKNMWFNLLPLLTDVFTKISVIHPT